MFAMIFPKKLYRLFCVGRWVVSCLLAVPVIGVAGEFNIESLGVRGGYAANDSGQGFNQTEAFMNWNLPWGWNLGRDWHLQSRLDLSAGWLGDRTIDGAIGTAGPSLLLQWGRFPVSVEGGSSPTVLSQSDFGAKDFGVPFQFTSHVGLNWDVTSHWRLGYRFQHMSNAGLDAHNPGLNMHMFGLSYLF
jgi:hypothetical protein